MKEALIVGNGKSSVNPYAKGLNEGKDVFRLNKFFLEPTINLGRKVKFISISGEPYTIFIIDFLIKLGIYNIEIASFREMPQKRFFLPSMKKTFIKWEEIENQYKLVNKINGFNGQNKIKKFRKVDKITSGPYLINLAIQMGYEVISIIGIDFYSEKSNKKYPIIIPKCLKDISIFDAQYRSIKRNKKKKSSYDDLVHSIETDMQYLEELFKTYSSIKFKIYVDEENPYNNWKKITKCFSNIELIKLDSYEPKEELNSHCLKEIEEAIIQYKCDYYWKDKIMNIRHLWSNRKSIVKKNLMYIKDKF